MVLTKSHKAGVVDPGDFGLFSRLRARLGFYARLGKLFLGYCGRHKVFFLDLEHTNGGIRCPVCDKDFLKRRGL